MTNNDTTDKDPEEQTRVREAVERLLADNPPETTEDRDFWGAQYDAGLAWVQFPEGNGGLGVSPAHQTLVSSMLDEAGASQRNRLVNILGIGMGAPVINTFGTDQQKQMLRPMFVVDEIWCQMFSEPGAGSDVAALATRAVRDGDEWIVNGQKVWTTLGHLAKWGMLVARTDPDVPKHKGLTYFLIDMESPGVEIRPLRQITGEAEFNEVYFTDARIPDSMRVGEIGDGWRVAIATLMNERVAIGGNVTPRESGSIGDVMKVWKERRPDDPGKRDELMKLWIEAEAMRLTTIRAGQAREAGTPGPEGSTGKLHWAEANKRIYEFGMELLGADAMLFTDYSYRAPSAEQRREEKDIREKFLRSRANSIEGGTTQIMKNILGERVLGLPGEPRVDKDLPWNEVPRS
ncbi:MAG: acyl-CoA dehydrogenase family protein [Acidimicrobiia bacterium]|nr:acyl-CoA dehydrogenase family protein [Acidimicrobiia bacterium]NNL48851.1 acyl-CoA dehydrogenase [Acidimicrobiia bacterium]